jgi:hypothetical protein
LLCGILDQWTRKKEEAMVCGEGSELADGMNGADWVLVFRALKDALVLSIQMLYENDGL